MFAEPQSVIVGGTTHTLPRTSMGTNSGTFTKDDSSVAMTVSHNYAKRTRRTAGLTSVKTTADPFIPSQNVKVNARVYLVVDAPPAGFTAAELKDMVVGLATWITATSGANAVKLLGGES